MPYTNIKYADSVAGDDNNSGDQNSPYKHIMQGVAKGATQVLCNPNATYVEDINMQDSPHRYPVTIEGNLNNPSACLIQGSNNTRGTLQLFNSPNDFTLKGFTVLGDGAVGSSSIGIHAGSATAFLWNCIFSKIGTAIWSDAFSKITLYNTLKDASGAIIPANHDCNWNAVLCGSGTSHGSVFLLGDHIFSGMKYGVRVQRNSFFEANNLTLNPSQTVPSHAGNFYIDQLSQALVTGKLTINKAPGYAVNVTVNSFCEVGDLILNDCASPLRLQDRSQFIALGTTKLTGITPNIYDTQPGCVCDTKGVLNPNVVVPPYSQYTYDQRYQLKP